MKESDKECVFDVSFNTRTGQKQKKIQRARFESVDFLHARGNGETHFLKDVMDARNLWEFVTSLNKYLEKKSFRVPLQTNHHRFSKSPELKIAETQDSTWQKYHIFSHCSYSSPILFFSTGLCC